MSIEEREIMLVNKKNNRRKSTENSNRIGAMSSITMARRQIMSLNVAKMKKIIQSIALMLLSILVLSNVSSDIRMQKSAIVTISFNRVLYIVSDDHYYFQNFSFIVWT